MIIRCQQCKNLATRLGYVFCYLEAVHSNPLLSYAFADTQKIQKKELDCMKYSYNAFHVVESLKFKSASVLPC